NLGDHVSGPLAPRETAEILMARQFLSVSGNHDRLVVAGVPDGMSSIDQIAAQQLETTHLNWLRAQSPSAQLSERVFACHGTPRSDTTYWMEHVTPSGDVVLRDREEIESEAEDLDGTLFLCGHTHIARRVDLSGGRCIVNPGSVGCPAYGDTSPVNHAVQNGTATAAYAIVEASEHGWITSCRRIPYDASRMIEAAIKLDHPQWVERLKSGWLLQ
ncbi:MAG: metallophosphoesterase family protein, partial [Pseudomonadota bacterium]